MRLELIRLVNGLLEEVSTIFFLGVLVILLFELPLVAHFIKTVAKSKKKFAKEHLLTLLPLGRRFLYVLGGLFVVQSSFVIVNETINAIEPKEPPVRALAPGAPWWDLFLYPFAQHSSYAGLVSVIFLIFSGIALMLSGGDRWMTGLSKLLATIAFAHIILTVFALTMFAAPA